MPTLTLALTLTFTLHFFLRYATLSTIPLALAPAFALAFDFLIVLPILYYLNAVLFFPDDLH
ncbi:hypothetical protein QBC34DRAFT_387871, partial [Podospora aff. communis PSN243]